jgi:broad specificity phosphatase PhoE
MDSYPTKRPNTAASHTLTTFGLLRHGTTVWNKEKRVQGLRNSPLTEEGVLQMKLWAATCGEMGWNRIIASDLGRVKQTVAILNDKLNLPVSFDERLREQSWGDWEGMRVSDVREQYPDVLTKQVESGWEFTPPGGESRSHARDRAFEALDEAHTTNTGQNILVVCHIGIMKCLLYAITQRSFLPHEPSLLEKNRLHCISHNDTGYTITELNINPGKDTGSNR